MAGSSKGAKSESGRHEEPSGVLPRGQILCPLKRLTSCLPLPQVFGYLVHPFFVSYAAPLLASKPRWFISFGSTAPHGIAAVHALVARAISHGDGAAVVTRRCIAHERGGCLTQC